MIDSITGVEVFVTDDLVEKCLLAGYVTVGGTKEQADEFAGLKIDALKEIADSESVDITGLKSKASIIEAIKAARTEQADDEDDEDDE
jgi:hypothetical protein